MKRSDGIGCENVKNFDKILAEKKRAKRGLRRGGRAYVASDVPFTFYVCAFQ